MKIIVVEDDDGIAAFIGRGLREEGFLVEVETRGDTALKRIRSTAFDLAVVDIMLPGMNGLTLIERLRAAGEELPILILSARQSVDDRVLGFRKGGDDYLIKPFAFSELLVRIQALLKRSDRLPRSNTLEIAGLQLNRLTREVRRNGTRIELQPHEYTLLEYLMQNAGTVLSKTLILEHVWEYQFDPQTNVVDVLVSRLRSRVDRGFEQKFIHTVRGVGYVLREPEKMET